MADRFVTVDIATSPWDAHITKGRLESEGIPVFVAHEGYVSIDWTISQALGGVRLQVAAEHEAQAREALAAIRSGTCKEALREEFSELDDNACPQCGNDTFTSKFTWRTIMLILLLFFGFEVIFPARRERHTCLKCQRQWDY